MEPKDIRYTIADNIRMARLLRRKSQKDLGGAVGLSLQQIQKYERGTNRVSADILLAIAQALNIDIKFFYDGKWGN